MLVGVSTPPNTPTPDYGTLGPGSDIKMGPETKRQPGFTAGLFLPTSAPRPQGAKPPQAVAAIAIGAILAAFAIAGLTARKAFTDAQRIRNETLSASRSRSSYDSSAQKEAEELLQRAARNDASATHEIAQRAASWHGRIKLTPQLTNLVGAGLNAKDLDTRAVTIRLDLAAMNVSEDSSSVERLASQAESRDQATRIWALWTLGLLANRGIETERITNLLIAHLSDPDVDARHWAVEGLAYAGTDASIQPLLKTLHDDPSPAIRERAACSLAESGMLTPEQRHTAIPTLLTYADDPVLDNATHAWTYHALRDITGQRLPDDAAAWRKWYQASQN